jgi:hypothetical protein
MLRPTVSRPVCLGIKHPSGAYDQIFTTVRARVSGYIALDRTTAQKIRPSPSNGRLLFLCICWNVFTGSLLSNGHGTDPHKNTSCNTCSTVVCAYCGRYLTIGLLYCRLRICCGLFTESLPSNGYMRHIITFMIMLLYIIHISFMFQRINYFVQYCLHFFHLPLCLITDIFKL